MMAVHFPPAPWMEMLEPRRLMSGGEIVAPQGGPIPPLPGFDEYTQVIDAGGKWTFKDGDGDLVTVALGGTKGQVEIVRLAPADGQGDIERIRVTGTDAKCTLSITIKPAFKDKDPNTYVRGTFSFASSMLKVSAPTTTVLDTFSITGGVGSLALGDVSGGGVVLGSDPAIPGVAITLGSVTDAQLSSTAPITSLTVYDWVDTDAVPDSITAPALLKTTAQGDFDADMDIDAGGIGPITIVGGDLNGDLVSDGAIGPIAIKGIEYFDGDFGDVVGGSYGGARIDAATTIGNISLTGGGLGRADQPVTVKAGGNVGSIVVKAVKYRSWTDEIELLNPDGSPKLDKYGDPATKLVTYSSYAGGGIWVDLDTPGKLGKLTAAGGDLAGDIHAAAGIGNITVNALLAYKAGKYAGLDRVTELDEEFVFAGDLLAGLRAEPGAALPAIGAINVFGGDIRGDITAVGKVGKITGKGFVVWNGEAGEAPVIIGGGMACDVQASALAGVTLTGGRLAGSLSAPSIGAISVTGGDVDLIATARNAMGAVTAKALVVNATAVKSGAGYNVIPGRHFGGSFQMTLHLGGTADDLNLAAKCGAISGVGINVVVDGEIPSDPTKAKITSKAVVYTSDLDVVDGKLVKVFTEIGDQATNNLTQLVP